MGKFWDFYEANKHRVSGAVDDVRHKLVEEGWFVRPQGRAVTGAIEEPAAPEPAKPKHDHHALYAEVWGEAPAHSDVYGQSPTQIAGPAIEPPKPLPALPGPEPEV